MLRLYYNYNNREMNLIMIIIIIVILNSNYFVCCGLTMKMLRAVSSLNIMIWLLKL